MKATLRFQLAVITLAAIVAAWFLAPPPILTPLFYLTPTNWTGAELVRHLWPFRLIQPEWVSNPPQYDYLRWAQAETLARLAMMFLGWLGGATWLLQRHLRRRKITPPSPVALGNGAIALTFHAGSLRRAVPEPQC